MAENRKAWADYYRDRRKAREVIPALIKLSGVKLNPTCLKGNHYNDLSEAIKRNAEPGIAGQALAGAIGDIGATIADKRTRLIGPRDKRAEIGSKVGRNTFTTDLSISHRLNSKFAEETGKASVALGDSFRRKIGIQFMRTRGEPRVEVRRNTWGGNSIRDIIVHAPTLGFLKAVGYIGGIKVNLITTAGEMPQAKDIPISVEYISDYTADETKMKSALCHCLSAVGGEEGYALTMKWVSVLANEGSPVVGVHEDMMKSKHAARLNMGRILRGQAK